MNFWPVRHKQLPNAIEIFPLSLLIMNNEQTRCLRWGMCLQRHGFRTGTHYAVFPSSWTSWLPNTAAFPKTAARVNTSLAWQEAEACGSKGLRQTLEKKPFCVQGGITDYADRVQRPWSAGAAVGAGEAWVISWHPRFSEAVLMRSVIFSGDMSH